MTDAREARLRLFLWQLSPALREAVAEALAVAPAVRTKKQHELADPFVAWVMHDKPLPKDMAQDTLEELDGPRPEPCLPSLRDLLAQTGRL